MYTMNNYCVLSQLPTGSCACSLSTCWWNVNHKLCQVYSKLYNNVLCKFTVYMYNFTIITQPIVVIVHDIFCAPQASSHKARVHRQCYKTETETHGTVCTFCNILQYVTVNCQTTSKCDNAARSELLFTLCRVTVMACSDVSGSPVDEQTFIQVRVQWCWQLVAINNIPSPPPQLSFQVIHTARDDSCGGGLGMRLGCNGGLFSVCQLPHTMLKWEVDQVGNWQIKAMLASGQ